MGYLRGGGGGKRRAAEGFSQKALLRKRSGIDGFFSNTKSSLKQETAGEQRQKQRCRWDSVELGAAHTTGDYLGTSIYYKWLAGNLCIVCLLDAVMKSLSKPKKAQKCYPHPNCF